jgi:hypothetical protein
MPAGEFPGEPPQPAADPQGRRFPEEYSVGEMTVAKKIHPTGYGEQIALAEPQPQVLRQE